MGISRKMSIAHNQPSQLNQNEPMILSTNLVVATIEGKYFPPDSGITSAGFVAGTVADKAGWLAPVAGTLNNLNLLLDGAATTNALTITVYKNNASTALSATVALTATTGYDRTDQVPVAAGDYISLFCSTSGTTVATNGAAALQFVPT